MGLQMEAEALLRRRIPQARLAGWARAVAAFCRCPKARC